MEQAFTDFIRINPEIRVGISAMEKHGLALFLNYGAKHLNETSRDTGEICHLHTLVSAKASSGDALHSKVLLLLH